MNSKTKMHKNVTRLVALFLAALLIIGLLAYFTTGSSKPAFDYSKGLTEEGFFKDVNAQENITLPDYASYKMPADRTTATEEEVEAEIEKIKANFTKEEKDVDTERAIVDGDRVNIDFTGKIDGTEFEGGSTLGQGSDVYVGSGQLIPGFEEQLIGHKPGEEFDINVTFPEDYKNNEELSGKDAVFTIKVNHYYKAIVPEITDEFVKENLGNYYESVDDMKTKIAEEIVVAKQKDFVVNNLINDSEVLKYPESMMEYVKNARIAYVEQTAAQYGMTGEQFVKAVGVNTMDEYIESIKEDIKNGVKVYLVMQAVAEKENIRVEKDDIKAYFKQYFGTEDYSMFEQAYGMPYIKLSVLSEKVTNMLIENMEVAPVDAAE